MGCSGVMAMKQEYGSDRFAVAGNWTFSQFIVKVAKKSGERRYIHLDLLTV